MARQKVGWTDRDDTCPFHLIPTEHRGPIDSRTATLLPGSSAPQQKLKGKDKALFTQTSNWRPYRRSEAHLLPESVWNKLKIITKLWRAKRLIWWMYSLLVRLFKLRPSWSGFVWVFEFDICVQDSAPHVKKTRKFFGHCWWQPIKLIWMRSRKWGHILLPFL